jgi:hypothetical protein
MFYQDALRVDMDDLSNSPWHGIPNAVEMTVIHQL